MVADNQIFLSAQAVEKELLAPAIDSAVPAPRKAPAGDGGPGTDSGNARYNWRYTMNFGADPASAEANSVRLFSVNIYAFLRRGPR